MLLTPSLPKNVFQDRNKKDLCKVIGRTRIFTHFILLLVPSRKKIIVLKSFVVFYRKMILRVRSQTEISECSEHKIKKKFDIIEVKWTSTLKYRLNHVKIVIPSPPSQVSIG